MALHGDLKNMPLPDILQSLKANNQSGTLYLQDVKKEFGLFFEKDAITCIFPGQPTRDYFPPILCLRLNVAAEVITRELNKKSKASIVERLQKSRIAEADTITSLHRVYLIESLYDVFAWHSGTFRFEDGDHPGSIFDSDQCTAGIRLEIDQVLFESMRRSDEWKLIAKQIPTMDEVCTVVDEFRPRVEELTEPEKTIYRFCNGENNVREIAYRSGQDFFTTAQILCGGLKVDAIRYISASDLIALAEKAVTSNKHDEAQRYFRRAIELDRSNIDVRHRFADLCVQMEKRQDATNEYKTIAQLSRERKDFERAKAFYRQIIAMNPSEYEFQKRLYEMLHEIGDPETRVMGMELCDTLRRLGLFKEEVQILQQLIEDHNDDIICIERLGDAEQALGNKKAASENFYRAAELSVRRNDVKSACLNYQKVVALDPDDTKAWKMIDELQSGIYLEKRRRRRKIILAVECGMAAAVVCFYAVYLTVSVVDYLGMRNRGLQYVANHDFASLRDAADAFGRKYPLSFIYFDLRKYQREIERICHTAPPETQGVSPVKLNKPSAGVSPFDTPFVDRTSTPQVTDDTAVATVDTAGQSRDSFLDTTDRVAADTSVNRYGL